VIVISDCSVEFTVLCDDRTSILRDGETVGMVDIRARGVEKAIVELVLEAEVERRRVGCTRRR
jgi:ABC-type sugar transport system ATPase subunit